MLAENGILLLSYYLHVYTMCGIVSIYSGESPFYAVLACLYRASPRLSVSPFFSEKQGGRALRAAPDRAWHLVRLWLANAIVF